MAKGLKLAGVLAHISLQLGCNIWVIYELSLRLVEENKLEQNPTTDLFHFYSENWCLVSLSHTFVLVQ